MMNSKVMIMMDLSEEIKTKTVILFIIRIFNILKHVSVRVVTMMTMILSETDQKNANTL